MDITLIYPFLPVIGCSICIFSVQACMFFRHRRDYYQLTNRIDTIQLPPAAIAVSIPEYYPPRYIVNPQNIV